MKSLPETLTTFDLGNNKNGHFYSLPALEKAGIGPISRLPISIRIVLESVLRHCDGEKITAKDVTTLANWQPGAERVDEIPFTVARIILQDFTGVPLLVDLAAMRDAVARLKQDPKLIEPLVPVDLVVDHSVQVDFAGEPRAFQLNLDYEFKRNRERYQFLKWGMQAFETFKVVPPGIGIVHQVNLEYLAKGVIVKECEISGKKIQIYYPDTLVGTDSHTTMINGLGIVGWGVGGIEAEAGMLGQPVYFLTPDVVGVHLTGTLKEGVTATDLALTITQLLRQTKVVGKFVEFFGPGAEALPVVDRATIANMAPEYGATMGFFPIDTECVNYLRATGRSEEHCKLYENYYRAQGLWGVPKKGEIDYSQVVELDLNTVTPSVAGPKRPQDRIQLNNLKNKFVELFSKPVSESGYAKSLDELNKRVKINNHHRPHVEPLQDYGMRKERVSPSESEMRDQHPAPDSVANVNPELHAEIGHGSVLIAAITSCTNTSNPSVMLAAGLLAKKAVERGLKVSPTIKTSLAPGSRVVSEYFAQTGLQTYLDQLGFNLVGYGCTTCIGNSGPLESHIEEAVLKNDLVAASVLSGNRNFEARVHQSIKANFLMSPPLVVAFALAGRVDLDLSQEPLGTDKEGKSVYLKDIWPSQQEVRDTLRTALKAEMFQKLYRDFADQNPKWNEIPSSTGAIYEWNKESTYIHNPPFFENFSLDYPPIQEIKQARALGIFADSITTDHISPAGAIKKTSPAGLFLQDHGVKAEDFNSYGSRRGNDLVMTRGTFANVRIKNLMLNGEEGGNTLLQPNGEKMSIFDAAMQYKKQDIPLVVIAGQEYGTGSSRDWAAKGTALLGVKAVIAQSYERIHRSNLVGMGVLPLQFLEGTNAATLQLDGTEIYDIVGLDQNLKPQQNLTLRITRKNGTIAEVPVKCRIDTPIEIDYYQHGGILSYVLRQLLKKG
ncbi:MAG: aconitate hydratase [Verrucomicrobiae bacterium]|nr:aconitate hydratase [Verrucomicrobiae bacterium]